jgi:GPH family glycoside/pentoside/hexuronide:cation symporter
MTWTCAAEWLAALCREALSMAKPLAGAAPAVSRSLLLLFALPGILQSFMHAPAGAILQGIYAKESGIALMALGAAVLAVRVFDIFSDLLIGYLSDYTARRGISRKLWMAAGTAVTVLALWFLFRPSPQVSVLYYGFWFLMANIGWSLVEIPYKSWSLEFSPDPVQRTRIVTWIAVASLIGGLLFYAVAPAGKALGLLETSELNMQLLGLVAIVVVLLLPALNFIALWRVPDSRLPGANAPEQAIAKESVALLWKSVIGNAPLIRLIACFSITNFMTGMSQGVSLLYLTNYLLLSSSVNVVFAMVLPISMLGIPFWGWVMGKYPRQRVWAVSLALAGLFYGSLGLLEPHTSIVLLGVLFCSMMFCALSVVVAVPVIMGDIIDYGREKFGVERAGLYMSLQGQVVKGVAAVSAGAGLIFLGWAGFDASKTGEALTPQAVSALKWVMAWFPALGLMLTGAILWFFPINGSPQKLSAPIHAEA